MVANGTLVWYYKICKRQVWFMGRGISPDKENLPLLEGRTLSEIFFKRFGGEKEIMVDNRIKVDILRGKLVIEVKKSSKFIEASKMQVLFYLYYFKRFKGVELEGILTFPKERKRVNVRLSGDDEKELERIIKDIERIVNSPSPPPSKRIRFCRKCAYKEVCWV